MRSIRLVAQHAYLQCNQHFYPSIYSFFMRMPRFNKEKRDVYYREAKVVGYRARSAFKLLQLHDVYRILGDDEHPIRRVVDLCAAPGSWSQVLSQHLHGGRSGSAEPTLSTEAVKDTTTTIVGDSDAKTVEEARTLLTGEHEPIIVAVDLQEMAPIDGVITLQGDITSAQTANKVISYFGGLPADLVICDGAPDVTGIHDLDEYVHAQLLLAALNITTHILRKGGNFVAKMFKVDDMSLMYSQMKMFFQRVDIVKPKSSRSKSMESFVVCRGYQPIPGYIPSMETPSYGVTWLTPRAEVEACKEPDVNKIVVPFMAIGDLVGFSAPVPSIPDTSDEPVECEERLHAAMQARMAHYEALLKTEA